MYDTWICLYRLMLSSSPEWSRKNPAFCDLVIDTAPATQSLPLGMQPLALVEELFSAAGPRLERLAENQRACYSNQAEACAIATNTSSIRPKWVCTGSDTLPTLPFLHDKDDTWVNQAKKDVKTVLDHRICFDNVSIPFLFFLSFSVDTPLCFLGPNGH